VKEFIKLTLKF